MNPRDDWDAALFAAAREGDLTQASEALAAGANVNAVNPHNVTPLLEASGQEHLEMTRYLIGQGAEIPRQHRMHTLSPASIESAASRL
jgi:ankyrin repeat protein